MTRINSGQPNKPESEDWDNSIKRIKKNIESDSQST